MRKLLVGLIVALAFPAGARAADSLYLSLDRTKVAPGWWLGGSVMSADDYSRKDIFGLTLTRSFAGRRGEESHALRANHERSTLAFDGGSGRWRTTGQIGSVAVVDMEIEATGAAAPVRELLGCRAELGWSATPVRLTGTLLLRTGTRAFATIRRTRLTGTVTRTTGLLDCSTNDVGPCVRSSTLQAQDPRASFIASRRSLVLQFSRALRVGALGTATWYHVLRLEGFDALRGTLPTLTVTVPHASGVRGRATFESGEPRTDVKYGCRVTAALGRITGSFTARFTGWGERTLRLGPRTFAEYTATS